MDGPKAYLAGPDVFLRDWIALVERKQAICAAAGLRGVSPVDGKPPGAPVSDLERAMATSRGNEAVMDGCDLIIANMTPFRGPSADAGTCYEIGYMRAQGKPVFAYTNTTATYLERVERFYGDALDRRPDAGRIEDPARMAVEDFGLRDNLMLEGAVRSGAAEAVICAADAPTDALFEDLEAFKACVALAARTLGVKRS